MKKTNAMGKDKNSEGIVSLSAYIQVLLESIEQEGDIPLSQRAYFVTKDLIRNLKLAPGQMILERELVEVLSMSRTPVREGLVRLEMEGWIKIIPRRGFFVVDIEPNDIQQIFEIVEALDELAISLATTCAKDEDLDRLEQIIAAQEQALHEDNLLAWTNLDTLFHEKIMDMAQNPRLKHARSIQYDHLYRANLYTIKWRSKPTFSLLEHRALLANMRAKESEAARIMLRTHRMRTVKEIRQALDKIQSQS